MNKQQNKQKLWTTHIYIHISCKCDTNRAGHFTLDAHAARPVACWWTETPCHMTPLQCWISMAIKCKTSMCTAWGRGRIWSIKQWINDCTLTNIPIVNRTILWLKMFWCWFNCNKDIFFNTFGSRRFFVYIHYVMLFFKDTPAAGCLYRDKPKWWLKLRNWSQLIHQMAITGC